LACIYFLFRKIIIPLCIFRKDIEIPKEKYDKLNEAVKKMRMPYYNVAEFIEDHINKALEQYEKLIGEEK